MPFRRLLRQPLYFGPVVLLSTALVNAQEPASSGFVQPDFPLATPVEAPRGAAPLDLMGKTDYYLKSIASPQSIGRLALTTGFKQLTGGTPYMESFASRYAEHVTRRTVQFGIGALRGEDPRFRPSGKEGFWSRTAFVLSRTVVADMDNGGTSIAAGRLIGHFAGNTLSSYWDPARPSPLKNGLKDTGVSLAGDVGIRMLREFWPDLKKTFLK
jgi:hypothetical protein